MLRNFSQFFPVPATLGIPFPALSSLSPVPLLPPILLGSYPMFPLLPLRALFYLTELVYQTGIFKNRGVYHLTEGTGWNEHWLMVRDFPKSANQPNEMALTIWSSVSCYCFPLMRDWNWEIVQMVRKFPTFRSERKKRTTSGGSPQFPNGFSGKLLFHLTFNRNFRIFWLNGKHPPIPLLVRFVLSSQLIHVHKI